MESEESITVWIKQLRAGDDAAARELWDRYYRNMVDLARRKLVGTPRRSADEEDVALSAFKSFCHAALNGRFSKPLNGDNLWQLLFTLTARKAVDLVRRENSQKRKGSLHVSDFDLDLLVSPELAPDFAAQIAEQRHYLMEQLGDPQLRQIAEWKMDGFTSAEIAARSGCTERTVERKLRVIRRLWNEEAKS
jgi:DNA-directed RNA polymerase specialized sigma24 family protein